MNTESVIETGWGCNKCGSDNHLSDSNCFHCGTHKGFKAEKFKNIEEIKIDKTAMVKVEVFERLEKTDKSFWGMRSLARIIMLLGIIAGFIGLLNGNGKALFASSVIFTFGFLIWAPFAVMRANIIKGKADNDLRKILPREKKS